MRVFFSHITSSFPPPDLLLMPATGINVSDHSIKYLSFDGVDKKRRLGVHGKVALPDGVVLDGNIEKPRAVIRALRKLNEDVLPSPFIRVSIPEEKGFVFTAHLPDLEEDEIREAITLQLSEHIPIKSDDAYFGFDIIDSKTANQHVAVSVLPKKVIEQYVTICSEAGVIPLSFEIEAQTIARAVVDKEDNSSYMIVDIGRTRTGISIVEKQIVRYTSTLEMGGDSFSEVIASHRNVSFEEADQMKQKQGFTKNDSDLYFSLVNVVSAFKDEINRRLDYWESQRKNSAVEHGKIHTLILCGGNATVPGLAEHFSRHIHVDSRTADVWVNAIDVDRQVPDIPRNVSLEYASTIGLALNNSM